MKSTRPNPRPKQVGSRPAKPSVAKQSQNATRLTQSPGKIPAMDLPEVPGLDGGCRLQDARFLNREEGLLGFNERVLALADDPATPLLERLRFVTIVSNNLDEFFEVRMAELRQKLALGRGDTGVLVRTINAHAARVNQLVSAQYKLLEKTILPALAGEGIVILTTPLWDKRIRQWAGEVFENEIEPLLTPIALDPAHPFPNVLNKSLNFIVELEGLDAFGRNADVAVVQAPRALPRVLTVPSEVTGQPHGVILLTSIVQGFVGRLFPGLKVRAVHQFRVTRNSDMHVDDASIIDLLAALETELSQRNYGDSVRLEVSDEIGDRLMTRLLNETELESRDCYRVKGPVNLVRLQQVIDLVDRPDLKFPRFEPDNVPALRNKDLFEAISRKDILLHHPYDSFAPVMEFLKSAASDPQVVAIKQTIYRTGTDSELMESLIAASHAGKAVTVVVELMARFDEETNINWANRLEKAGVHVVYGVVGHKTHAKMALIVRRENGRLCRYAHLGTGNYHPTTARLYEDFGMFTCDEDLCNDVHEVFRRMTGLGQAGALKAVWQSPFTLADGVIASIQREAKNARNGRKARIAAKMNSLVEARVVEALYDASQAGVEIDLIIRGACVLRPGIAGLSENIRVRSIVGRFLEHSRVYYFLNDGKHDLWLASADWMDRNLYRRVEVAFPVRAPKLKKRVIERAITTHLRDNSSAWLMKSDGTYKRASPKRGAKALISQVELLGSAALGSAD